MGEHQVRMLPFYFFFLFIDFVYCRLSVLPNVAPCHLNCEINAGINTRSLNVLP